MIVAIGHEIAYTLELNPVLRLDHSQIRLDRAVFVHGERIRVEVVEHVALAAAGVFGREQSIVLAYRGFLAVAGRYPVDHALGLDAVGRVVAEGVGVIGAMHFHDLAGIVLDHIGGFDHIGIAQTYALAQHQALVFLVGLFAEILFLDQDFMRERQAALAQIVAVRMAGGGELFDAVFRIVGDHDLERIEHAHRPRRVVVQVVTNGVFEHRGIDHAVGTGHADRFAEVADRRRRIAAPTNTGQRGHARVVPAVDNVLVDQALELALAGDGVVEVEPPEFGLHGPGRHRQMLDEPVIERAMILEFQRTDGVGHAFDGVRLAVGEIVGRVDAPFVAGLMMRGMPDSIDHRVAQIHVAGGHVDLGAQRGLAFAEFTGTHLFEGRQVFGRGAIAIGAVRARGIPVAAVFACLFGSQLVDVGIAVFDQVQGVFVKGIEIVRRKAHMTIPVEAQPVHVFLNGIDEGLFLFLRVGVVEAQPTPPTEVLGQTKVQTDRFRMADMQKAVRLGRKACDHLAHVIAALDLLGDHVAYEIVAGPGRRRCVVAHKCHPRSCPQAERKT